MYVSLRWGHPYKLYKPRTYNTVRASHFSIRIVNVWNSLPADRVDFFSFASFKRTVQQTNFTPFLLCSHTQLFSGVIVSILDLIIQFTLCTWMWCFYIFLFTCVTCVRINDDYVIWCSILTFKEFHNTGFEVLHKPTFPELLGFQTNNCLLSSLRQSVANFGTAVCGWLGVDCWCGIRAGLET